MTLKELTDKAISDMEEFSHNDQLWMTAVLKAVYEEGRNSVLEELKEDRKKFLQGFAYKPTKPSDV